MAAAAGMTMRAHATGAVPPSRASIQMATGGVPPGRPGTRPGRTPSGPGHRAAAGDKTVRRRDRPPGHEVTGPSQATRTQPPERGDRWTSWVWPHHAGRGGRSRPAPGGEAMPGQPRRRPTQDRSPGSGVTSGDRGIRGVGCRRRTRGGRSRRPTRGGQSRRPIRVGRSRGPIRGRRCRPATLAGLGPCPDRGRCVRRMNSVGVGHATT